MLTICSMASSCPTIILRRFVSRLSASRPVFVGSKGTLTRNILAPLNTPCGPFTSDRLLSQFPYQQVVYQTLDILLRRLLPWFCGPYLDSADQSALGHS